MVLHSLGRSVRIAHGDCLDDAQMFRHPTMSRHPVTPMHEADLRLHLGAQTRRRIELIDMVQVRLEDAGARAERLSGDDTPVVLIDVLDEETLVAAGRLVWERRGKGIFSASSSGLQYALAAYWRSLGLLPQLPSLPVAEAVSAIAAVSGSCSPVTASQLRWARANGFTTERLQLQRALNDEQAEAEIERCADIAARSIRQGASAIVFSAEGPDDSAVLGFNSIAEAARLSRSEAARRVGATLAEVMRRLLDRVPVRRVVVAGGDSSGEVASALGIDALSVSGAMAPGSPLCRAWSALPGRDGLEIALKGGQVGAASFFGSVRAGRVL